MTRKAISAWGGRRRAPRLMLGAMAVLTAAALAACGSSGGSGGSGGSSASSGSSGASQASGGSKAPIKIGVMSDHIPLTAVEGAEMTVNTDLAVSQINAAGGINGHKLQVVYADPQGKPDEAISLAQQLVQQDGVDVLVGSVLSSECLGVEGVAARLHVPYLTSTGCASEEVTRTKCNKYTFRFGPVGRQTVIPDAKYAVKTYGKDWAIIYPDYAFGQSQLAAYKVGMQAVGGKLTQIIPIPENEPNMTSYITKIHTNGSVKGIINAEVGSDLVRASKAISQFNLNNKLPVVGVFGKERFGGVYPASLTGDIGTTPELSESTNKYEVAYHKAFKAQLAKESSSIVSALGGAANAVSGDLGYEAYVPIKALGKAMNQVNYTGKSDNDKLINALAHIKFSQGPNSPGGTTIMNPADHQGAETTYVAQIHGQKETVLDTVTASNLPSIGNCHV